MQKKMQQQQKKNTSNETPPPLKKKKIIKTQTEKNALDTQFRFEVFMYVQPFWRVLNFSIVLFFADI